MIFVFLLATVLSSLSFWTLRPEDGESVSRGASPTPVTAPIEA